MTEHITVYGKRLGNNFYVYKDKECSKDKLKAIFIGTWFRKNRVITINCFKFKLEIVK